jgi:S1-C subfamily serine protease
MKKKQRNKGIIVAVVVLLFVSILVIGGAVASVFAYRQFSENDSVAISFSTSSRQENKDEPQAGAPISENGVLVQHVAPDSPAAEAGLRRGSIILEVDGQQVNTPRELQQAIGQYEAGDTVTLTVLNCEEPEEIAVILGSAGPFLGVDVGAGPRLGELGQFHGDFDLPPGFSIPGLPDGPFHGIPDDIPSIPRQFHMPAIVFSVVPDSPADEAGLQTGDIISEVDGEPVESRDQLIEMIGQKAPGEEVELAIQRGSESLTLTVTLAEHPDDSSRGYLGIHLSPALRQREIFPSQQNS